MDTATLKFSRRSLFEMVWSQPMTKLGKRSFKISDVALTKICRRHEIPVPGPWISGESRSPATR